MEVLKKNVLFILFFVNMLHLFLVIKNYCSDSIINVCSYGWERDRNSGDLVDTRLGLVDSTKWCNRDFEPW